MAALRFPDVRRMMLIGDSVFAVSITLLAHAVDVPKSLTGDALDTPEFRRFMVDVGGVVLSVVVASMFWLGHWRYLRNVRTADPRLIVAHFAFLLGLILLPISTSFYVQNLFNGIATFVYGCNVLYESLAAILFRRCAILNTPGASRSLVHHVPQVIVTALFATSVAMAFHSPRHAQMLWYFALCTPFLEIWVQRRLRAQAVQAEASSSRA